MTTTTTTYGAQMRTLLTLLVAVGSVMVAAALVLGIVIGARLVGTPGQPDRVVPCPAEDACTIDYRDGAWHVSTPTYTPDHPSTPDRTQGR